MLERLDSQYCALMTTPPNEYEEWLLDDISGLGIPMIAQRVENAKTLVELEKIRVGYAPQVLGKFRKMFGKGLAAEADKRMDAAKAQVNELIDQRASQLKSEEK